MQRTFIIGDKWLYYKIYSGVKTADKILMDIIKPLNTKLTSEKLIDKWFFIRYADPKSHLRWRLHLTETNNIGKVIEIVFTICNPFIESGQIHIIQTDTYKRELERYGFDLIELTETLFWHDSIMIIEMLSLIEGEEGRKIRWLFSLRAIDSLLDDFNFSIDRKIVLLDILQDSFGKEFNKNTFLRRQLSKKFRGERKAISEILNYRNDNKSEMLPLFELMTNKSLKIKTVVKDVLSILNLNKSGISIENLMGSYIHMTMNRIFSSRQRLHEMVIYDFLYTFYKSEKAKLANLKSKAN